MSYEFPEGGAHTGDGAEAVYCIWAVTRKPRIERHREARSRETATRRVLDGAAGAKKQDAAIAH
jgi:hypothetical protein